MRLLLMVGLGSGAGGALRWWIGEIAGTRSGIPYPTLAINVAGSFILGLVAARAAAPAGMRPEWLAFLGAGFCGGFTTFSAFSLETIRLMQSGNAKTAAAYVAGSVLLSVTAAYLGYVGALTALRR